MGWSELLPGVPFFDDFAVDDASKVDADEGDGFAGFPHEHLGRHAGGDLIAFNELIFDNKGIAMVNEELVKIADAFAEAFEIAVTGGGVSDVAGCDVLLQRIDVAGGVKFNELSKDCFL